MAPKDALPARRTVKGRSPKRGRNKGRPVTKTAKRSGPEVPVTEPACLVIGDMSSCPEWQEILPRYPMIDSAQREDFPDHGASIAYLAHFYRTGDIAGESARAQAEFRSFFRDIGYKCDRAGNFRSRWFEGVGIRIG